MRSFWKHIGEDDEDYDVGATFEARPDWIGMRFVKIFLRTL